MSEYLGSKAFGSHCWAGSIGLSRSAHLPMPPPPPSLPGLLGQHPFRQSACLCLHLGLSHGGDNRGALDSIQPWPPPFHRSPGTGSVYKGTTSQCVCPIPCSREKLQGKHDPGLTPSPPPAGVPSFGVWGHTCHAFFLGLHKDPP